MEKNLKLLKPPIPNTGAWVLENGLFVGIWDCDLI
jgi:hypothetical protein